MAENVAARELANLMQGQQAAVSQADQDARIAAEKGQQAGQMRASASKEADLALPEAIATGVVGSFLLGPVGGLLLGAAQGWLGKQERQNILDQHAAQNEALTDAWDITSGKLDSMVDAAASPEEREQLQVVRASLDTAREMMTVDPQAFQQIFQAAQADMLDISQAQDQRAIDDKVRRDTLRREEGDRQLARFDTIFERYDSDTEPFLMANMQANRVAELLENGTPAQIQASLTAFSKFLDPTSAALAGEVAANAAFDQSAVGQVNRYVNQLVDGEQLTDRQRRDLAEAVITIRGQIQKEVGIAQMEAINQLQDAELDMKFYDNFNRTDTMPTFQHSAEFLAIPLPEKTKPPENTSNDGSTIRGGAARRQRRQRAVN